MKKEFLCSLLLFLLVISLIAIPTLADDGDESLWGKAITPELVELPQSAYDSSMTSPMIVGISGDGEKVLIFGYNCAPYLWDFNTGKKTFLIPGNTYSEEILALSCDATMARLPEKQQNYLSRKYADVEGWRELAIFSDESLGLIRATVSRGGDDRYLLVTNGALFGDALVDCQTGEMHICPEGSLSLPVVDGKVINYQIPGYHIVDLQSGEITEYGPPDDQSAVTFARFLPDGSVAMILRGLPMNRDAGQECVLCVRRTDGTEERYSLGVVKSLAEPNVLLCNGDGSCLCAYNRERVQVMKPFLVDRNEGKVSLLVREGGNYLALPLSDCLDENGAAQTPEAYAQSVLIPYAEMRDGTVLVTDMMEGDLALLRMEDMATHILIDEKSIEETDYMTIRNNLIFSPPPLSGNGYNIFAFPKMTQYVFFKERTGGLSGLLDFFFH